MYAWLLSVLIVMISDKVCTALTGAKLNKMGYIYKKVQGRFSLANIISWIIVLLPYVNLVLLASIWGVAIKSLVDDEFLLKWSQDSRHSARDVKGVYESRPIKKDVLRDAMVLDGADEKTISEEMAKVDTLLQGIVSNDDLFERISNTPEYTEKEYDWACAQYNAEMLLQEIEWDTELDKKQKSQLLQLFRDSYIQEMKGIESKTDIVKKALSIIK